MFSGIPVYSIAEKEQEKQLQALGGRSSLFGWRGTLWI